VDVLKDIEWWNWPETVLKDHSYIFQGKIEDNIIELIRVSEKLKEHN
jgi:hypothetical protein